MAGFVHIPWYATGLRHDKLAPALAGIASVSLRYGARSYAVHRSQDDRYKFLQIVEFDDKEQWERYWNGPEFTDFRVLASSWYQVPVLYVWHELIAAGTVEPEVVAEGSTEVSRA
jgi:quinol monooxygenase YgiN